MKYVEHGNLTRLQSGDPVLIEIRNNLWQVGGMGITDKSDAGVFLVRFGQSAALIDAGTGRDHAGLRTNIDKCLGPDVQLEYLLLTHCHFDHSGGANAIRKDYGCQIVAHELDAVYLESGDDRVTGAPWYGAKAQPFPIDVKWRGDRRSFSVGDGLIDAIHSPGHSPGSVAYATVIDCELVLFGSDVHGPLHSDLLSDEKQYLHSLTRLLELNADLLIESHFGAIEPREEVNAFIEYWRSPIGVSHYAVLYAPDDWDSRRRKDISVKKPE